jgi:signal transduction histidine kinase
MRNENDFHDTLNSDRNNENHSTNEQNFFGNKEPRKKVRSMGGTLSQFVSTFKKSDLIENSKVDQAVKSESNSRSLAFIQKHINNKPENINSFSSIFRKDHEAIKGIQRVFRKSMLFLALKTILFALIAFMSVSLFKTSLFTLGLVLIAYIIVSNVFFIIVADKSYVWINLIIEAVLLFFAHLTIGLAFSPVTLILIFMIFVFAFYSYAELEKVQLGSRLFTIGQITSESTSALLTMLIILLSLGLYNSISSLGLEKVFQTAVLDNPAIFNRFVMGDGKNSTNLNSIYNLSFKTQTSTKTLTLADYLTSHFRNDKDVLPDSEKSILREQCLSVKTKEECADSILLTPIRLARLQEWREIAYPKANYPLETQLDQTKFRELAKQFYINQICIIEKGENCEKNKQLSYQKISDQEATTTRAKVADALTKDIPFASKAPSNVGFDRADIIPILLSVLLFILLSVLKPIIKLSVFIVTWIFWQILKLFGFVKIEVETVEAEVVSI